MWEHAAEAAFTNADWATAAEQAGQAADAYRQCGDARSAARAQVIAGQDHHDALQMLLTDPRLPGVVDDIVVDFGNAR